MARTKQTLSKGMKSCLCNKCFRHTFAPGGISKICDGPRVYVRPPQTRRPFDPSLHSRRPRPLLQKISDHEVECFCNKCDMRNKIRAKFSTVPRVEVRLPATPRGRFSENPEILSIQQETASVVQKLSGDDDNELPDIDVLEALPPPEKPQDRIKNWMEDADTKRTITSASLISWKEIRQTFKQFDRAEIEKSNKMHYAPRARYPKEDDTKPMKKSTETQ